MENAAAFKEYSVWAGHRNRTGKSPWRNCERLRPRPRQTFAAKLN
jgi:hypothetical protein